MAKPIAKLLDWFSLNNGAPTHEQIGRAFKKLDQTWDYGETSDQQLWESDPQAAHVFDAYNELSVRPQTAFAKLLKLAKGGSVPAMQYVAHSYLDGLGVAVDEREAESWFRRAFEGGSLRGLLDYAGLLANRREWERAEAVYADGAAQDWAPALYWLAWTRLKRSKTRQAYREALPLLERSAALGNPRAQFSLARNMARGQFGWTKIPRGMRLMWRFSKRRFPLVDEHLEKAKI